MKLLSLSTEIPVATSIQEIESLLVNHGALDVRKRYGNTRPRQVEGVGFTLQTPAGVVEYLVPVDVARTSRAIEADKRAEARHRTPEHARMVAWRIALRWLQVTLALVDVGYTTAAAAVSSFEEVRPGVPLYQAVERGERPVLALPAGRV